MDDLQEDMTITLTLNQRWVTEAVFERLESFGYQPQTVTMNVAKEARGFGTDDHDVVVFKGAAATVKGVPVKQP